MPIKLANNATSTIVTGINASDVGVVLATGDGAKFPALAAGEYFYITFESSGGTYEIAKATARAGDSLTIVRAQEGTTAQSFAAGSRVELRITAQGVEDLVDDYDDALRADLAASGGAALIGNTPAGTIAATTVQGALNEIVSDLAASSGTSLVGHIASGSGATARTVQAKLQESVSVKDFGAVGNGVADDTAAFQAALNATNNSGAFGSFTTVYIPTGEYKITATLDVPATACMWGEGEGSILRTYAVNCLNFLASNVIGPRRIGNFWIYGNGADANTAISVDLNSAGGSRCTGLLFENIYVAFFGTAWFLRGSWGATLRKCVTNHTHTAVWIDDQTIKTHITDCYFTHGGLVSGTGDSKGVIVGSGGIYPARPEDTWITNSVIYGFDIGCDWRLALYGGIAGCDFDNSQINCVKITTASGGFVVRDCWLVVSPADGTSAGSPVYFPALGYVENTAHNILIENNKIELKTSDTSINSYGLYVGSNNWDICINNNSFLCAIGGQSAIRIDNGKRIKVTNNQCDTSFEMFTSEECFVDENNFTTGIFLGSGGVVNTGTVWGRNTGLNATYAIGGITFPGGSLTETVTFASLGLPDLPANISGFITFTNTGNLSTGAIWGTFTSTNITCNKTIAFGGVSGISFQINCYGN
jgi:hypothetical protein